MRSAGTPALDVSEVDGRVRLSLGGIGRGEGASLQEAADDLVRHLLLIAMAFQASGVGRISSECHPDFALLDFVFEVAQIAARGDDIRPRLFGSQDAP
jgi:hypothetical protein